MSKLYAIHKDGRELYFPLWDSNGEIINQPGLLIAAVSIDSAGKTFPEGSLWIRKPRSWVIAAEWKLLADTTNTRHKIVKAHKKRSRYSLEYKQARMMGRPAKSASQPVDSTGQKQQFL